jgi:hypothetical protein
VELNELSQVMQAFLDAYDRESNFKLGDIIREHVKPEKEPTRSFQINELMAALAKAQGEMEIAGLHNENPYFKSKYADLATIVRASRPALTKNGLAVVQQILPNDDGQSMLHTILGHSSGQYIETRMRIVPPKNDIQTLGSYITYLRRYSYASIVGCVAGNEDDDGEVAMVDARQMVAKGPSTKYNPKQSSFETVTKEQLDELEYELEEYPDLAEEIMDKMQIQSLADLPKSKYGVSIRRIREIKAARNGTNVKTVV